MNEEEFIDVNGISNCYIGKYNINDTITITETTKDNKIKTIETNDKDTIKIYNIEKKYYISFAKTKKNKGYIKIYFENKKSRLYGIYIGDPGEADADDRDCLYFNVVKSTNLNEIIDIINITSQLHLECIFVYQMFYDNKWLSYEIIKKDYENSNYMEKYINFFLKFLKCVEFYNKSDKKIKVIYEPYFLSNIFKKSNKINPKKIYINCYLNGKQGSNLVDYIKYIDTVSKNIELVHIINIPILSTVKEKERVSDFYNYFIINNYYIAFETNSNEYLFFIKEVMERLNDNINKKYSFDKEKKLYAILCNSVI